MNISFKLNLLLVYHYVCCNLTKFFGYTYFFKKNNNLLIKETFLPKLFFLSTLILLSLYATSSFMFLYSYVIQTTYAIPINNSLANTENKINNSEKKIAFVEPTFTYAAYQFNSFYNFYQKYSPLRYSQENTTITTDLYLLKDRPIPHGPFPYYSHPSYSDIPYKNYFDVLQQHVKKTNATIANLTDVDVDQGKIFQPNGLNAYDILFLFHNEYETQKEYNNLKHFVSNGGTIVFTEGNILYAEVSYNNNTDSITLVNGHDWKFDGKVAKNSLSERWLNENKEWMGSNFFNVPSDKNVLFRNNPFNYTHVEEQYVTNPNAKILIDYQAYNIPSKYKGQYPNPIIATYEMSYEKGKVINLGIWGHTLTKNQKFLDYFDNVIIPLAFNLPTNNEGLDSSVTKCANYDSKSNKITVTCNTNLSGIYKDINNSKVLQKNPNGVWILNTSIEVNPQSKLTINNTDTSWLKITNKNATEPNYISISGSAKINGVKITSWDPVSNNIIKQNENGTIPRAYINIIKSTGNVNISNSELAFLGYNFYPSNGLVYSNAGNGSSIVNNTFHDMWDGLYSDHAGFITIKNNSYYNNFRNGLDPHSGSHDLFIVGNSAFNNSKIGIACPQNCYNIFIYNNTVHNNKNVGILLSENTSNSTVSKNLAYDEKVGISIYSSSNNKIFENVINKSDRGIFVGGNSSNNHLYNNSITNTKTGIYFTGHPIGNDLKNNYLSNVSSTIHF
jgi:parallel beta-helix repeat protein